jgi:hypothetical protein
MPEILKTLKDTLLPIALVIGGVIFLLISFAQKKNSKEVGVEIANQSLAGIIGFVLLVIGIGLYSISSGVTASIPPTATLPVVVPSTESQNSQSQPANVVVKPTTATIHPRPTATTTPNLYAGWVICWHNGGGYEYLIAYPESEYHLKKTG